MITITVDDKQIEVEQGANLLQVCLENDIYIPNLCYLGEMAEPPASCRLCWVAIEGIDQPTTACTKTITSPITVQTNTPEIRRLQQTALKLLLSVHHVDCKNCQANKNCALQDLAKFLKVPLKSKEMELTLKEPEVDNTHPTLDYHPNRCVLCGKCLYVCQNDNGQAMLSFAKRGIHTVVSAFGAQALNNDACISCQACADICPVGALIKRTED